MDRIDAGAALPSTATGVSTSLEGMDSSEILNVYSTQITKELRTYPETGHPADSKNESFQILNAYHQQRTKEIQAQVLAKHAGQLATVSADCFGHAERLIKYQNTVAAIDQMLFDKQEAHTQDVKQLFSQLTDAVTEHVAQTIALRQESISKVLHHETVAHYDQRLDACRKELQKSVELAQEQQHS